VSVIIMCKLLMKYCTVMSATSIFLSLQSKVFTTYTIVLTFGKSTVCSHTVYWCHAILRITNIVFLHNNKRSGFAETVPRYFCEAFSAYSMKFPSIGKVTTSEATLLCWCLQNSDVFSVLRVESGPCSCSSCYVIICEP
jgi:hypothetical protein